MSHMNVIIANIKKLLAFIDADQAKIQEPNHNNLFGRQATAPKKFRAASRQNHSKGESKIRRKMAAKSRRINRRK